MLRSLTIAGLSAAFSFSIAPAAEVDYARDVRAIFKERCWSCHGALQQQSELRLDTVAFMTQGGA
ncbi:MAG: hypothetical protein SFV23_26225, partial [Planctomycetaceae bacterium]|nr:hypothetical protein [Planctomycetaceae bacterium]